MGIFKKITRPGKVTGRLPEDVKISVTSGYALKYAKLGILLQKKPNYLNFIDFNMISRSQTLSPCPNKSNT
jgi:hypothetical protein